MTPEHLSLFLIDWCELHYWCVGPDNYNIIYSWTAIGPLNWRETETKVIWDTRNTDRVLKWVLVCIARFCWASQYQIWIPEIL